MLESSAYLAKRVGVAGEIIPFRSGMGLASQLVDATVHGVDGFNEMFEHGKVSLCMLSPTAVIEGTACELVRMHVPRQNSELRGII